MEEYQDFLSSGVYHTSDLEEELEPESHWPFGGESLEELAVSWIRQGIIDDLVRREMASMRRNESVPETSTLPLPSDKKSTISKYSTGPGQYNLPDQLSELSLVEGKEEVQGKSTLKTLKPESTRRNCKRSLVLERKTPSLRKGCRVEKKAGRVMQLSLPLRMLLPREPKTRDAEVEEVQVKKRTEEDWQNENNVKDLVDTFPSNVHPCVARRTPWPDNFMR